MMENQPGSRGTQNDGEITFEDVSEGFGVWVSRGWGGFVWVWMGIFVRACINVCRSGGMLVYMNVHARVESGFVAGLIS